MPLLLQHEPRLQIRHFVLQRCHFGIAYIQNITISVRKILGESHCKFLIRLDDCNQSAQAVEQEMRINLLLQSKIV